MKKHVHLGIYGITISDNKILLIKKKSGPYDGLLDLPGGTIEYCEKPENALKREFIEETGITINEYHLYDTNSVVVEWEAEKNIMVKTHHICIFYIIDAYDNKIKEDIAIDKNNDDSLGAKWVELKNLKEDELSAITVLALKNLNYLSNK